LESNLMIIWNTNEGWAFYGATMTKKKKLKIGDFIYWESDKTITDYPEGDLGIVVRIDERGDGSKIMQMV